MAKNRYINTRFWDDSYIITLDPIEKLLYLYFITNTLTSICGIYEISTSRIGFDTGIDKDMVFKILQRFKRENKILYKDNWIAIKNFMKHQKQSDNPEDKINIGIKIELKNVPKELVEWVNHKAPYKGLARGLNYSNTNTNTNSNIADKKSASSKKKNPLDKIDLKVEIQKLIDSPQRHIHIAGLWIEENPPSVNTYGALQTTLNRNLRPAKDLMGYPDDKIKDAIQFVQAEGEKNNYDPGLETVIKKINRL